MFLFGYKAIWRNVELSNCYIACEMVSKFIIELLMKKMKLVKEEKAILDSFNKGEWKSIKSKKIINKLRTSARNTINKKKPICN